MTKRIHNKEELKGFRKELRNNLTSAEAYLWNYLKEKKLDGRKFRRQHSIKNYIVDFYCMKEKLIIELDGEIHKYQEEYDINREKVLEQIGAKILRFENKMVFENLPSVLQEITENFNKHI